MSTNEDVQVVSDAHVSMIERATSHYVRYVEDMWGVVVVHTRHILGDEAWYERIAPFEERYYEQIGYEHMLYDQQNLAATCEDDVLDIRARGLQDVADLREMHEALEHELLSELLAHRSMTARRALESRWLSQHRLSQHHALRVQLRYQLDTAWFYMRDVEAKHVNQWPEFDEVVHAARATFGAVHPTVVPL